MPKQYYLSLDNFLEKNLKVLGTQLLQLRGVESEEGIDIDPDEVIFAESITKEPQGNHATLIEAMFASHYGDFFIQLLISHQGEIIETQLSLIFFTDLWTYDLHSGRFISEKGLSISSELFPCLEPLIGFTRAFKQEIENQLR